MYVFEVACMDMTPQSRTLWWHFFRLTRTHAKVNDAERIITSRWNLNRGSKRCHLAGFLKSFPAYICQCFQAIISFDIDNTQCAMMPSDNCSKAPLCIWIVSVKREVLQTYSKSCSSFCSVAGVREEVYCTELPNQNTSFRSHFGSSVMLGYAQVGWRPFLLKF